MPTLARMFDRRRRGYEAVGYTLLAPARALAAEALTLESEISTLVNAAYALTPDEVALMCFCLNSSPS
jgi:hypothetical protein